MFRAHFSLIFLVLFSLLSLSVYAIPTGNDKSLALRQATRSSVVARAERRLASPVRRQDPSPVPFIPRTFYIRNPDGQYYTPTWQGESSYLRSSATGTSAATLFTITSSGSLQPADAPTLFAYVGNAAVAAVQLFSDATAGGIDSVAKLVCSITPGSQVLSCAASPTGEFGSYGDAVDPDRFLSIASPDQIFPVVVEYAP